MHALEYPFDPQYIIKKKKSIKRELLGRDISYVEKKIAVLGGSTTHDIIAVLDLFLLNAGIRAEFYESEYAKYWEDVMFDNPELVAFQPDLIYIHTSFRNLKNLPDLQMSEADAEAGLAAEFSQFRMLWEKIENTYHCPVIQNNFEFPPYRILGNYEATDPRGTIRYINRLNEQFAQYAAAHKDFYLQDIQYLSACYGLDKWADPHYWHMYKYALAVDAIPTLSYNLSNIMKSLFGKNKKALALDLDNTLWGGIIGDDGVENIEIGPETPMGQVYAEFQSYIKKQKDLGVILNVCSKNEKENALAGLNHPDSILKPDDFILIKANWDPKSKNLVETAKQLDLLPESFVFVDDNPAEREIIRAQVDGAATPEIGSVEDYIRVIDHAGFFEVTTLSADDAKRNEMYKQNAQRAELAQTIGDYGEYLRSLEMKGTIGSFIPMYLDRIAQLTNKSNQFNLTTHRYTRAEIEEIAGSDAYIDLYGKLEDKFGDNGVVSVVIGHKDAQVLHMDLWIMSCRVLKRDMEFAMMDELVKRAQEAGIRTIRGYYYPTAKNHMVENFYAQMGFQKTAEDADGNTEWEFAVDASYRCQNQYIEVNGNGKK
ncbi:MAG: HAD-IIIC family phosphatase [Lachnospiraceae bacterium]|nr:HAD-IIIC family phosphatase [Lachnospiraceae bacterium]